MSHGLHVIFLPNDYLEEWFYTYTEQYLLISYLLCRAMATRVSCRALYPSDRSLVEILDPVMKQLRLQGAPAIRGAICLCAN
jgi:hypothetical protein